MIFIVVPAYNEERKIGDVIDDLQKHGYKNIVVVDDGSKDQTKVIVEQYDVHVVHHGIEYC